jgi:hypothetical protein
LKNIVLHPSLCAFSASVVRRGRRRGRRRSWSSSSVVRGWLVGWGKVLSNNNQRSYFRFSYSFSAKSKTGLEGIRRTCRTEKRQNQRLIGSNCSKNIFGCWVVIADMGNVEYSEWVPAGALVKGLFVMVSSIIVFVSFAVFLFSEQSLVENILGIAFAWVILAFLLLVFWNYRGLRIQITDDRLSLDYGLFNKKSFLLKEIGSCKKTKTFRRYLGVGVRYGLDGSMAYTTSFANAVEVIPKVGRAFVFSSKNPERICEIVTKGMLSWNKGSFNELDP